MAQRYPLIALLLVTVLILPQGCNRDTITSTVDGNGPPSFTDMQTRILRNNLFAMDFYEKVAEDTIGNFMISPYSTSVAFAMLYKGARGQTSIDISETMHFNYPPENGFDAAMKLLNSTLCGRDTDEFTLKMANGCWIDRSYQVLQVFQDGLVFYYDTELDTLDFAGDPEGSRAIINDWIYEESDHWLMDAFPPDAINQDSRLVLSNTFCFQAKWFKCFDPDFTYNGQFELLDGSTVTVPFMHGEDTFQTFDGEGFDALKLSYEGELVSMLLLLPDEGNFESFEAGLESSFLISLYDSLETGFTHVKLPRWHINTELDLSKMLTEMGMGRAFGPGAEFWGIDGTDDGEPWISTVVHKTHMWVNEHGTGAYATTGIVLTVGIVPHFDAVRPFIFAIVDEPTGTIMFMGRVMEANGSFPPFGYQ